MSNKPVMFEFPVGSGWMWNANEHHHVASVNYEPCFVEGKYPYTQRLKEWDFDRLEDFFKAKLKAQGWLSPDDQRPFCMESARELGVEFDKKSRYFVGFKSGFKGVYTSSELLTCMEYPSAWFYPLGDYNLQDPHETRRLEQAGVARCQKEIE